MLTTDPHNIIAIGSSAGGIEELTHFFDNTPLDSVAYVIIQHLSPDFKSRMVHLLEKHSKLRVKEAEENMRVEKNMVYLIPSTKFMTIEEGHLKLQNKELTPAPYLTINVFFTSLAKDQGTKAVGVILSGMGSDGTAGIKAIKNAGGLVIARDPEKAEFSSMPSNAVATGMVDFILEPELMPQAILEYISNLGHLELTKDDEKNMAAILEVVNHNRPLNFSEYKPATILRRIKRRAAHHQFGKLDMYIDFLKANPEEVDALAKDFLISVSSFFRDPEAFQYIETEIIPKIIAQAKGGEELKIWVAGCATGEEAYSLAMLVCEQLKGQYEDTVVKIFATDVDDVALAQASRGVYNESIANSMPPERLESHFIKEGSNYRVKADIRKMLIFAHHDVVKNPPYCNMHFISCRNMLIYMNPVLQSKIYHMMLFGLKKEGYLFLGPSENPSPILQSLEILNKKWKLYQAREPKQPLQFESFSNPVLANLKATPPAPSPPEPSAANIITLVDTVNKAAMDELGYTLICINEFNQVIQTFGDTTKYLLQKNFTLDLNELLPKPLALAFASATRQAADTNGRVVIHGINIENHPAPVNLVVKPLQVRKANQKLQLVFLSDDISSSIPQNQRKEFNENIYLDEYMINMEEELKELKNELKVTYDKLESSSENMQSFNEELLSANEEMQSTNEEMQSVNEELHTINTDYQAKNRELIELNDDLNNYFRSNVNGQLFVNRDLLLMKYSPGTVQHINLLESDIGRPLTNISTNIKFETLAADIKKVITTGGLITKEVEANNGKAYQLMTMPYIRQADNTINGAIITFTDITEIKKAQYLVDITNKNLRRINADLDNFVLSASHDLLGPLSNIEVTINLLNQVKTANPDLEQYLDIINVSVKKFRLLIKELSTIGKIESDIFNMEAVDVAELIEEIKSSISDRIETTGAIITTDLPVAIIKFSKKNLRSILFNLISNSLKYKNNKRAPVIHITTSLHENYVQLSVQDNGVGISGKDLPKVFKVYSQLDHDIEGQGIGLYLVKKVVESAGGKVMVESEPGIGSTFTIFFKTQQVPESALLPA